MRTRRHLFAAALVGAIVAISSQGYGQTLANRNIQLVVPFAPGAGTDGLARATAPEAGKRLGETMIVENRPGAAGSLGTNYVAKSSPDGQRLLVGGHWVVVNPYLFKHASVDPTTDLTPVAHLARQPLVLVVSPEVKANNLAELVVLARANPGKLTYGTPGMGTPVHLAAEVFKSSARVDILGVSYRGSAPALSDLIGGQISLMMLGPSSTKSFIESGKLRALAVTGKERLPLLPEVPTFGEAGYPLPEIDDGSWWGIFAPGGTSDSIVNTIAGAFESSLNDPVVRSSLQTAGFIVDFRSAAVFKEMIRNEDRVWSDFIKRAKIRKE